MTPALRSPCRWLRAVAAPLALALLPVCGDKPPAPPEPPVCTPPGIPELERSPQSAPGGVRAQDTSEDIRTFLGRVPGLMIVSEEAVDGFRFFLLEFEQPADHSRPQGERFSQRLSLFHRSADAPMVIDTEGEALFDLPIAAEPVYLLGGNQVTVEHRFFGSSRPASNDWKLLTIEQASADFHRVVETFKPYYRARWLSTGVFKGGTAAILHRYLYPDDVDATIPYALQHSFGQEDARAQQHLARVGEGACRVRLEALQRAALERREELVPLMDARAAEEGTRFDVLGRDRALEFAVITLPFNFWQRSGFLDWSCDNLPDPSAPTAELFSFVSDVGDLVYAFSDLGLEYDAPLYYQYATQFGAPRYPEEHLRPLLRFPGELTPARLGPAGVEKPFDGQLMARAEAWMRDEAQRMLLVHGALDPWVASTFEANVCQDSYRLITAEGVGFYGALGELSEPARGFVFGKLSEWGGAPVMAPAAAPDARWRALAARRNAWALSLPGRH